MAYKKKLGGYSGEDPPLPIPNREVKLACADGTAYCGRVGSRQLQKGLSADAGRLFFLKVPGSVRNWKIFAIFDNRTIIY